MEKIQHHLLVALQILQNKSGTFCRSYTLSTGAPQEAAEEDKQL